MALGMVSILQLVVSYWHLCYWSHSHRLQYCIAIERCIRALSFGLCLGCLAVAALLRNCILRLSAIGANYQIWWHLIEPHCAVLGFIYYVSSQIIIQWELMILWLDTACGQMNFNVVDKLWSLKTISETISDHAKIFLIFDRPNRSVLL